MIAGNFGTSRSIGVAVTVSPFPTPEPAFERFAEAALPTKFGAFRVRVYRERATGLEHVALYRGELNGAADVLVRVHSECLTGEVLHSLRCDCGEQLELALERVGAAECGALLYLRQEGRGIGLGNKVRAYALQDEGMDTVDANRALNFPDDARDYAAAAFMLDDLAVRSVRLMTNNPDKVEGLTDHGVVVSERVPHRVASHELNRDYIHAKRERMGHLLPEND